MLKSQFLQPLFGPSPPVQKSGSDSGQAGNSVKLVKLRRRDFQRPGSDLSQEGKGDEEEILGAELQFRGLRPPVLSPTF